MTRVYVVVEGQTEESFIVDLLAPVLWPRQVYLIPILLGVRGHKGGRTNYAKVRKDILIKLKQDKTAYCSTMLDLYGLGTGFPGMPVPMNLPNVDKAKRIENAVTADICSQIPEFSPGLRLLPYIQLHEFEGLLFSDPTAFASAIRKPALAEVFQEVRDDFPTPEDINDTVDKAPSKRVRHAYPSYQKVLHGTLAARAVGIDAMQRECPHFRDWLKRLETLEPLAQ